MKLHTRRYYMVVGTERVWIVLSQVEAAPGNYVLSLNMGGKSVVFRLFLIGDVWQWFGLIWSGFSLTLGPWRANGKWQGHSKRQGKATFGRHGNGRLGFFICYCMWLHILVRYMGA